MPGGLLLRDQSGLRSRAKLLALGSKLSHYYEGSYALNNFLVAITRLRFSLPIQWAIRGSYLSMQHKIELRDATYSDYTITD